MAIKKAGHYFIYQPRQSTLSFFFVVMWLAFGYWFFLILMNEYDMNHHFHFWFLIYFHFCLPIYIWFADFFPLSIISIYNILVCKCVPFWDFSFPKKSYAGFNNPFLWWWLVFLFGLSTRNTQQTTLPIMSNMYFKFFCFCCFFNKQIRLFFILVLTKLMISKEKIVLEMKRGKNNLSSIQND